MTNPPYGPTPEGQWPPLGPPAGPPPAWPTAAPRQSRLPIIISLVVAFVAVAVAIGAWLRPAVDTTAQADSAPKFSDAQTADAKTAVCSAYRKMVQSVSGAGGQSSTDPVMQQVIAVNTRLATFTGSEYLLRQLAAYPATSPQLGDDVRELADSYTEVVLAQLANTSKDAIEPLYSRVDAADAKIVEACK